MQKVKTVEREVKRVPITHYHVWVGNQPIRTVSDEALAQHIAIEEKAKLVRMGCDITIPEFEVVVESETKEIEQVVVKDAAEKKETVAA